jgi:hypothetical protein
MHAWMLDQSQDSHALNFAIIRSQPSIQRAWRMARCGSWGRDAAVGTALPSRWLPAPVRVPSLGSSVQPP